MSFLAVFSISLVAIAARTVRPGPFEILVIPTVVLALMLAGAIVFRRQLVATRFNRHITATLIYLMTVLVGARGLGLVWELDAATQLSRDAFIMASGFSVAAIAYLRWIAWIALAYLGCAVLCVAYPGVALPIFGIVTAANTVVAAGFAWRDRR